MQTKTTAKDFFLCLGIIIGLYVSAISFLMSAFQVIDIVFPLAGEYTWGIDSGSTYYIFLGLCLFIQYWCKRPASKA